MRNVVAAKFTSFDEQRSAHGVLDCLDGFVLIATTSGAKQIRVGNRANHHGGAHHLLRRCRCCIESRGDNICRLCRSLTGSDQLGNQQRHAARSTDNVCRIDLGIRSSEQCHIVDRQRTKERGGASAASIPNRLGQRDAS